MLINFAVKRLAEIFGIIVFSAGSLLLLALLTYSPEDPNFIFPRDTDIKNIFGFSKIKNFKGIKKGIISYSLPSASILINIVINLVLIHFLVILASSL